MKKQQRIVLGELAWMQWQRLRGELASVERMVLERP